MKSSKPQELRQMDESTLTEKLQSLRGSLFDQRLQASLGKLENPMVQKTTRREIARVQTVLSEKARGKK